MTSFERKTQTKENQMGMIDRDWYKEHHQKQKRQRTLDRDIRETIEEKIEFKPTRQNYRFSLYNFVLLTVLLITAMVLIF